MFVRCALKKYNSEKYPSGLDTVIYDEYLLIFNETKELNELRNNIVNDYNNININNNIIIEYNKLIKSLNQAQQEKSPNTRTILDFES